MAGGFLWKALGTGSAIGMGILAKKVATSVWKVAAGKEPPANPADPEVTWREALAWAVASGAIVGIARMVTTRKLADYWVKSTGSLPPDLQKAS
ncbi:MAG: DUF4235 domain-containing protein [Actinomycetota bacterium]|nr:DUF4235 domain-containing protein [Actinomycetota bacterium]